MGLLNVAELKSLLLKSNSFLHRDLLTLPVFKFVIDNVHLGFIRQDMLEAISVYREVFQINSDKANSTIVTLNNDLKTPKQKSEAINDVFLQMKAKNICKLMKFWRNEKYSVFSDNRRKFWFEIERSATGILGVARYGVHINGYTVNDGVYSMWIAKRSLRKHTYPGLYDNLAAGGCNSQFSIYENAANECQEEAGIPKDMLRNLKPTGCISLVYEDENGILPEIMYCYDLKLPKDFRPVNGDGEVESCSLKSSEEVLNLIGKPIFKFNSALAILGFYFRHGLIKPDECDDYYDLYQQLHTKIPLD